MELKSLSVVKKSMKARGMSLNDLKNPLQGVSFLLNTLLDEKKGWLFAKLSTRLEPQLRKISSAVPALAAICHAASISSVGACA